MVLGSAGPRPIRDMAVFSTYQNMDERFLPFTRMRAIEASSTAETKE